MKLIHVKSIQERVSRLTEKIPKGRVTSYKEIARKLNTSPRVVARALANNPHPIKIPCHRVVHSDGRLGGYTPKGKKEKARLLRKEGIKIEAGKIGRENFFYFK